MSSFFDKAFKQEDVEKVEDRLTKLSEDSEKLLEESRDVSSKISRNSDKLSELLNEETKEENAEKE